MKKAVIVLGICFCFASLQFVRAQSAPQTHIIQKGESLSQLAKKYNTTVGDIMRFNGMNSKSLLQIGQSVKIPPAGEHIVSSIAHTTAAEPAAPTENSKYAGKTHTVTAGESLYKISHTYQIPISDLKAWNNLSENKIVVGQVLQLSSVHGSEPVATAKPAPETDQTISEQLPVRADNSTPRKKKTNGSEPAATPAPQPKRETTTEVPAATTSETTTLAANNGGAFAPLFGQDVEGRTLQQTTGKAKTFKTQSGWNDQKYYILMNDVAPGAIVKVTYNGVSIFAKVLWNMNNIKENEGLTFRLSDAAVSVLNISNDSFDLTVDYYE